MVDVFMGFRGAYGEYCEAVKGADNYLMTALICRDRLELEKSLLVAESVTSKTPAANSHERNFAMTAALLIGLANSNVSLITGHIPNDDSPLENVLIMLSFMTTVLLDEAIECGAAANRDKRLRLIVPKNWFTGYLMTVFDDYQRQMIKDVHGYDIRLIMNDNNDDYCLRAADCATFAVFQDIEHDVREPRRLIEDRIVLSVPFGMPPAMTVNGSGG